MKARSTTVVRILNAARELFNAKGYAATSSSEIAASLGISQGNLTYHFPTKRHLAMQIKADVLHLMKARRQSLTPGRLADDYVEHLMFGMELTWTIYFLMRDRVQYEEGPVEQGPESELTADFDELTRLLNRIGQEGLFANNAEKNTNVLARSLWIVSRYWMDYLRELEGLKEISWADQERGIQHHYAVLLPNLKSAARRDFQDALDQASGYVGTGGTIIRDKLSHAAGPLLPKN